MSSLVHTMASVVTFRMSPNYRINSVYKPNFRVKARSLGDGDSSVLSSESVAANGASVIRDKVKYGALVHSGDGRTKTRAVKDTVSEDLALLWEDGYGTKSVTDYLDEAKEIIKPDGGPPRWFCPVDCGPPLEDSPTLLFLPGIDGLGLGLVLHHRPLGKAFEVQCLHIPVSDQTPFEGLLQFVEKTVRLEHASSPNKPIYLVGDSLGGCLALAVAARNPNIDLVLILVNPATSFGRSQLQLLFPILEALPDELYVTVPYLLSFTMGEPTKMAMVNIDKRLPPILRSQQLSANLTALLPHLSGMANIIPKDTLLWKLKLLKSASAYANSRLHAVKAEVLVLASGKDNIFPSGDEAKRLKSSLQNCTIRLFKDNGHTLLLENNLSLLTIIKGTYKYRRSRKIDPILDFLPPSRTEFNYLFDQVVGLLNAAASAVMFSTLEDGKIVKGLAGIPNEGPVLLIGYHMLLGLELYPLIEQFFREKNIRFYGMAHPEIFLGRLEDPSYEFSLIDWLKVMIAVPVTGRNLFNLLSKKSHILLYPGGIREALHYKGEQYKLFWPNHQEFVRMAARFGATIVPFGVIGEDDIVELVLDYNDLMKIPVLSDNIRDLNNQSVKVRDEISGEVANQAIFVPGLLPKIPGRFYFLFGRPIHTKGREVLLRDKESANKLYLHIKSEVERNLSYLLKKREEDPYRSIIDRTAYNLMYGRDVPTFKL
ncbi:acyltransferase-like protein At1g54570, chloroplastic isoform X2 [Mangifera indica]|uniref:acyltransferase-like protein At1g54570, chloroplastic isoform X2 n=1 Tax=Mangifera indica TaxID=29780 RepID=UPI001CFAC3A0|nr:acyltransferase-like protein At1g54570, chloroplastic isoform X2 [Mangifera indica]